MKPLDQSIVKTLTYFDLINFPLMHEELFCYLWTPPRIGHAEFMSTCGETNYELKAMNYKLGCGYYFLPGRENLIAERQRAAEITDQKLIIARRAVKFIRSVPFLKAIFVCNSVGAAMARAESDIDFFIVSDKNRIWIVRFFTNLILRLFGLRTYGAHQADRICLSFYVDIDHLNLAPWRIADDDIHFAYWLNMMTPVYDPENYYEKFLQANRWVERYLPNLSFRASLPPKADTARRLPASGGRNLCPSSSEPEISHGVYTERSERVRNDKNNVADTRLGRLWKRAWEAMWQGSYGNVVENEAKKLQLTKMKFSLKEKAKRNDHGVVIADGVLKFHENDTRLAIRNKWLEKIQQLSSRTNVRDLSERQF